MKVKDLIEKLQQFSKDTEVFSYSVGCTGNKFKYLTHESNIKEERYVKLGNDILIAARLCEKTKGAKNVS